MKAKTVKIGIVGYGTVGTGVAKILFENARDITGRTGLKFELARVVDTDTTSPRQFELPEGILTDELDVLLEDKSIDIALELVGGTTFAKDLQLKLLRSGKHVVTANKALMAEYGPSLLALARSQKVSLSFEASCGGGIPVIRALTDGLAANRICALFGILNGTCNYILTAMAQEGKSYQAALSEAQVAGLAEADPTLDVSGLDTAHKLTILSSLAFGSNVALDEIPVTGIDSLQAIDVAYGQELGYTVKLLAIAKRLGGSLSLCVKPAFISKGHPLAWVSGPFNAISVYGSATGHTMYYGRGAGGLPTASAVIADIMGIATGTVLSVFDHFLWPDQTTRSQIVSPEETDSSYYVRVSAQDSPGVLAQIAACLGRHDISIRSVLQKEPPSHFDPSSGVPVVISTYGSKEGNMMKALEDIDRLDVIKQPSVCLAIVDEYPESDLT